MAKMTIKGEKSFKAIKDNMMIGPSESGYTLSYSADDENFTDYPDAVPAGENCIVLGTPTYSYWKLKGNQGEVTIIL